MLKFVFYYISCGRFENCELTGTLLQKICHQAAKHCLVSDHEDVLLTFQFHDHRFQTAD